MGQFNIPNIALSEVQPPGANHSVFFLDTENNKAPTIVTGPAGSLEVTVLPYAQKVVTSPVLAADAHDWEFEDLADAHVVRIAASVSGVRITGIRRDNVPATASRKTFVNVGSIPITLVDDGYGSLANNQLHLHGGAGDILLQPGDSQDLFSDDDTTKWRTI